MDKFELSADMLTNIKELDDQHRSLLSWGNVLCSQDSEDAVKKVEETLYNLTRYVSYHFRTEEDAMIRHDYELLGKHQIQHERLMLDVGKLVSRLHKEGATRGLLIELQYQFIDWFTQHIKEWDKPFAVFLQDSNFSESFTLKKEEPQVDWTQLDLMS